MKPDRILLKAKKVSALQRPAESDWRSVVNWIYSSGPLIESEQEFVRKREDLVTLRRGRECAGFDNLVERILRATDQSLKWCGWENNLIKASHYPWKSQRSGILTPEVANLCDQGAQGEDIGRFRDILRPGPCR